MYWKWEERKIGRGSKEMYGEQEDVERNGGEGG